MEKKEPERKQKLAREEAPLGRVGKGERERKCLAWTVYQKMI